MVNKCLPGEKCRSFISAFMGDSFSVELKKKASKLITLLLKREPVSCHSL